MQVVEREHDRLMSGEPVDDGEEPLDRGRYHAGPVEFGARVGRVEYRDHLGRVRAQRGGQRAQRQPLAVLVADRPVHPAMLGGRGGERRRDQRGLADARLALDPGHAATTAGESGHRLPQRRKLRIPPDRGGTGIHGRHWISLWSATTPVLSEMAYISDRRT